MSQHVTYRPADPLAVTSIDRLQLFTSSTRTGSPAVDIGPAVQQPDLTWQFTIPDGTPDGTYYAVTTVTYIDASTLDDADDIIALPVPAAAQPGDAITPWISAADLQADTALSGIDLSKLTEAAQVATEVLWALSGRQFPGLRQRTVRVLAPACPCGGRRWHNTTAVGFWGSASEARTAYPWGWGCGCPIEVQLPDESARQVLNVDLFGVGLDASAYRLDTGGRLVRLEGSAWPLPSSPAPNGLTISYLYGQRVPAAGVHAARLLASAYAREQQTGCKLPQRVTQITADGVSIALDDLKTLREGGTGVAIVDIWLHSVNPNRQQQRPRILSPSSPRFRTSVPSF